MAFWAVEVKPGKPYTHIHDSNRGPLRLSQVTLGNGTATKRSVLQCNVGNKSPVLLCSLLPDRAESSCLDLQFKESEEVIFSVVGPRSVHLAGYFIDGSSRCGGGNGNDSDSYGEDIWETGSVESGSHGSEDKYESDFIDDGDIEMSPSPRHSGGVVVEEIIGDEKPTKKNLIHRRLRKKHQVSDSDEGDVSSQCQIVVNHSKSPVLESEEEDGFPISFSMGNKDKEKNVGEDGKLDSKMLDVDKKRKLDVVVQGKSPEREDKVVAVSSGMSKKKKKDKIKDKDSEDQNKYADDKRDEAQPCEGENEKVNQDHVHEVVVTESSGKLKKRKKEKVRRGETLETRAELTVDKFEEGARTEKIDATNNIEQASIGNNDKDLLVKSGHQGVSDEKEVIGSSGKLKKRKKKTKDKSSFDEVNISAETLRKDRNDKSRSFEVIKNEASKSHKKMDEDQTVDGLPPEMTANVNEGPVPADVHHEPNKKKQKKKKSR